VSKLPHDTAHTHVTGQSEFVDDRPLMMGELFVEVFYSSEAHARIVKLDLKSAKAQAGVVAVLTAADLKENIWGSIFKDQPLLAKDEVNFVGEAIALVAGTTAEAARAGCERIKITYSKLPAILSIAEAKSKKSFIAGMRKIECGNIEQALSASPLKLNGNIVLRGADHFYLESQVTVAYPREGGQIEVHTSSQHPTETQHVVAHALGLPDKDVVCIVKRMGGAFGGKESQAAPFAAYAALVAHKLNRPARIVLTKDDDMIMTGKRNPFENSYQIGFDQSGKILAFDVQLYSDGGAYADLSTSIMERAMLHIDNAYFIPNLRVTGQVCRTNNHPHTAFRGFGGPKGVATIERAIEEIAHVLKMDPLEIRKLNCYKPGADQTHYGQVVQNNCLPVLFNQLEKSSDYRKRRLEIEKHNQSLLPTLRGLSLTAVKFGISFTTRFLNQGNALVILHRDGSLQVSTGATEMGQGVNARIAELVAHELGLNRDQVRMMPTATDKNANTSPTAASSGTDINGAAALLATRKIKARLSQVAAQLFKSPAEKWASKTAGLGTEKEILVKEAAGLFDLNTGVLVPGGAAIFEDIEFSDGLVFSKKNPSQQIKLVDLVNETYLNRISLSEYAFYRFPNLAFNKLTGKGDAFLYFTQGAAVSEVSVCRYTGEAKVLRVDILMDLGRPINQSLDIGQITGGFVQGMGWLTTEKLFYSEGGRLLSHSPSTYKIPSIQDTPRIFNTTLLPNDNNHVNVQGTKAVGEPPLLLAISVWTAIHDALKNLPQHMDAYPNLEAPATQEQILRSLAPKRFKELET
jgi:xanthine dehydrogenase large subunit